MSKRTWIILDMSYLGVRSHYALGMLRHEDQPTAVIFGILREMRSLAYRYQTENLIFVFDSKSNIRKDQFRWYKDRPEPAHIKERKAIVRQQLLIMRKEVLPSLGYRNILIANGYEADDLIAAAVTRIRDDFGTKDRIYIATADQDLYQCINARTKCIRATGTGDVIEMGVSEFKKNFCDLPPTLWPQIKAISGCTSDTIAGVDGVAEPTAAKYTAGQLKKGSTKYEAIRRFLKTKEFKRNLKLVTLPYPGCPEPKIVEEKQPKDKVWRKILEEFGIKSLSNEIDQREAREALPR